jgi:L-rhamnose mutarotase
MQRHAFKMRLNPGAWRPNTPAAMTRSGPTCAAAERPGISNYSIHLDRETMTLFGYLERRDDHGMDDLPNHPVMRRWWAYMGDIMATNPDGSPVAIPLVETFFLA